MQPGSDRRKHQRFPLSCPVKVRRGGVELSGHTLDISLGGICFRLDEGTLAVDDRVGVAFELPGADEPVATDAVVRWLDPIDPRKVGVQFLTGLRPKAVYAINRLTQRGG